MLLTAACSSDGFPESYSAQIDPETNMSNVQANWMAGCTVGLSESNDLAPQANSVCECSYNEISGPGGIPFEDFVELNDELKGNPNALGETEKPAEAALLEIVKGCIAGS